MCRERKFAEIYIYSPLEGATINCESKMEKQDSPAGKT